jgi:hypothetical protein
MKGSSLAQFRFVGENGELTRGGSGVTQKQKNKEINK